jgi:hypothetical protein
MVALKLDVNPDWGLQSPRRSDSSSSTKKAEVVEEAG